MAVTDGKQLRDVDFQALGQLQECLESRRELIVLYLRNGRSRHASATPKLPLSQTLLLAELLEAHAQKFREAWARQLGDNFTGECHSAKSRSQPLSH
jgi:hypothetical protein